jgi:hypothetical protein
VVGTVPLRLAQPENQLHRADLAKMLVHRRERRQGPGWQPVGVIPGYSLVPRGGMCDTRCF